MPLIVAYLAVLAAVLAVSWAGPIAERMLPLQLVWLVGSAAWVAAAVRLARRPAVEPGRGAVWWTIAGAVLLRGVVLAGDPALSDDVHRYAWEGGLVLEGVSPYAHAPSSPELAEFRERWPDRYAALNNADVSAAYPPLTQAACAAAVALAGGPEHAVLALRVLFTAADLLILVPLVVLLRRRGADPRLALVWGWSPLVALEFAGSGHFDSLGILLLLAALVAFERPVRARAREALGALGALALAGAVVTKLLPVAAVPFVARDRGARAVAVAALAAAAFVPILFLEGGFAGLGAGLGEYGLRWEASSLVYRFVEPLAASVTELFGAAGSGWSDPRRVARALIGAVWLAVVGASALRRVEPIAGTGAAIGLFLVLSPTLHPWYLTWVVPFVALDPSARARAPWLVLVALAPLAYWPLEGWIAEGVWEEPPWLWPVLALPFFALWARARLPRRGESAPTPA